MDEAEVELKEIKNELDETEKRYRQLIENHIEVVSKLDAILSKMPTPSQIEEPVIIQPEPEPETEPAKQTKTRLF